YLKPLEIDIREIRQLLYDSTRFKQVSVMIIDQKMPQMKGLELCKALSPYPVKKLLLTGEADKNLAIQAFNEGLIDHYLNKKEEPFFELLEKAIADLQKQYFETLFPALWEHLTCTKAEFPLDNLKDPHFYDFFQAFCEKHQIIEYYL